MSAKPEAKNDQIKDPVCDMMVSDGSEYTYLLADKLYSFVRILLTPMIAAAAMSFSSVSVISNSLRLKRVEL